METFVFAEEFDARVKWHQLLIQLGLDELTRRGEIEKDDDGNIVITVKE